MRKGEVQAQNGEGLRTEKLSVYAEMLKQV